MLVNRAFKWPVRNEAGEGEGGGGGAEPPKNDPPGGDPGEGNPGGEPPKKAAGENPEGSENWTAEQWKAHALELRKENAKRRTENKDLKTRFNGLNDRFSKFESGLKNLFGDGDDDNSTPEEKLENLQQTHGALEVETQILQTALELGVPKDKVKYFKFLTYEKLGSLEEGAEMTEEDWEDIMAEVGPTNTMSSTSVNDGKGKGQTPPSDSGNKSKITVEEFSKMSMMEKSELYNKDRETYNALVAEARGKGTFVQRHGDLQPRGISRL